MNTLKSSFLIDLKRHLRSPALLIVALAAPIAAYYMVPDKDASYAVLTINKAKPILTASVLGLELGVLAATLLSPLAYIFLRSGPSRKQPWQITDLTPHSRVMATLGRWASSTISLWILLLALSVAGLILGFFRLETDSSFLESLVALWLPAAPSLALIAAIRLFLDSRNLTRGWFGDVVFFFIWMALMVVGIVCSQVGDSDSLSSNPVTDAFGFTAPIAGSVDYEVTEVSIGGAANPDEDVMIDGWQGVTESRYVLSRVQWLLFSAGIAILAGLIWAPRKIRAHKQVFADRNEVAKSRLGDTPYLMPTRINVGSTSILSVVLSEVKLMLRNRFAIAFLLVAAVAGFVAPFRTVAGPAVLLAMIFPMTTASVRWRNRTLEQMLGTLGPSQLQRFGSLIAASILVATCCLLPSLIRSIAISDHQWYLHMAAIAFIAPCATVAIGWTTRRATAGRILMLIAWYVYLSAA